jgi:hypothetical protein
MLSSDKKYVFCPLSAIIRDPHKDEKMAAIHKALDECSTVHNRI